METMIIQFLIAFVIFSLSFTTVGKIIMKLPPLINILALFGYLILTYTFIAPWIMAIIGM